VIIVCLILAESNGNRKIAKIFRAKIFREK
jgi:hypothetical protein